MRYLVSFEEMEGRWIAHLPALPGCFSSATSREQAMLPLHTTVHDYIRWRQEHGDNILPPDTPLTFEVDEMIREWPSPHDPGYVVNAFFASDLVPLTADDVNTLRRLFEWSYADLLTAVANLPPEVMNQPVEGEWNISGIANHTSRAEWWYLDQLGLAPKGTAEPANWRERLEQTHQQMLNLLPELVDISRIEIKESAEIWSPRKMIRRALWHRRDHTRHIHQFREQLIGLSG